MFSGLTCLQPGLCHVAVFCCVRAVSRCLLLCSRRFVCVARMAHTLLCMQYIPCCTESWRNGINNAAACHINSITALFSGVQTYARGRAWYTFHARCRCTAPPCVPTRPPLSQMDAQLVSGVGVEVIDFFTPSEATRLFVTNVHPASTEDDMMAAFSEFGLLFNVAMLDNSGGSPSKPGAAIMSSSTCASGRGGGARRALTRCARRSALCESHRVILHTERRQAGQTHAKRHDVSRYVRAAPSCRPGVTAMRVQGESCAFWPPIHSWTGCRCCLPRCTGTAALLPPSAAV